MLTVRPRCTSPSWRLAKIPWNGHCSCLQAEEVAAVYETGRYMFVFNTKLCQKDKAAQVATRKAATLFTRVSLFM